MPAVGGWGWLLPTDPGPGEMLAMRQPFHFPSFQPSSDAWLCSSPQRTTVGAAQEDASAELGSQEQSVYFYFWQAANGGLNILEVVT